MLAKVALALAEARYAFARHDHAAEHAVLQTAQPGARLLREACKATWEVGVCTASQLAFAWQQADEIDRRFAILAGNVGFLKAVDKRRAMFFRRTAWACEQVCMMGSGTMEPDHLFAVLDAIERLNTRGLRLDEPLAHFTPEYNPWQAEEAEQAAADGLDSVEMGDELGMDDELEIEGESEMDGEP